jgi:hypothetical protein
MHAQGTDVGSFLLRCDFVGALCCGCGATECCATSYRRCHCGPIVLGFRGNEFAKWSALPCLVIWLAAMMIIWLFLFRWMCVQLWHFSPTEIAMSLIVRVGRLRGD